MAKSMEKVLWYIKTIIFVVKRLKVIAKCCLNWILKKIIRYSNIEYQDKIFKTNR
jgi:hypothetical protein